MASIFWNSQGIIMVNYLEGRTINGAYYVEELLFVLFRLYVAFNNLSVISRWCLGVAGRTMLTFRVLPH